MIDIRKGSAGALFAAAVLASLVACGASNAPGVAEPTSGSGTSPAGSASTTGTGVSSGASPSATNPGPTPTQSSNGSGMLVTGSVLSSPGCPGPARAESPCPDRPVAGARVEFARGTTVVATTTTDSAGRFEIRVPPGDYQVTAFNVGIHSRTTQTISVHGPVTVTLVVDSGLR
jgi:carboxypeptidase family protein